MDVDPLQDIYKMMDAAKLNAGHLLATRRPMGQLINEIRVKLAGDIAEYIKAREAERSTDNGTTGQQGHNPTGQNPPKIGGIGG